MDEDLRLKANSLFQQGVILYHRIKATEELKQVGDLWHRSLELYRQIGDTENIEKLEKYLASAYKDKLPAESGMRGVDEPMDSRVEQGKFRAWDIFLKIGFFGFGGPMAVFGLLQEELVNRKKILTHKDFMEGAVLGDILPGPVTMDIVTYTGYKLRKWIGAIYSTLIFILPSFVFMVGIAILYDKYRDLTKITSMFKCLGAAVTALIISVGLRLGEEEIKDYRAVGILIWSFSSSLIFKFDILSIVMLAGLAGILLYLTHEGNGGASL
jgi:chromate transporter